MLSLGAKLMQIAGLAGTKDVDERTSEFIENMLVLTDGGKRTSHLSEGRVKWIEDIHEKHFGKAQG
ncbi:MAG: hypothetical protein Q8P46_18270 [Hyphomicrobiales bacterium]|nr:hypothetical protein [Hyphomicrobiales bacterium]